MNASSAPHNQIAIIGTGFGAIATAVRLQRAGLSDFVLIDRAGDVGGVWRDNSYPGAAVDVKSHLYSLSFARRTPTGTTSSPSNRNCTNTCAVSSTSSTSGAGSLLGCEVEELRWDSIEHRWTLETELGQRTAQHVVVATGALAEPVIPDLPGLTSFNSLGCKRILLSDDYLPALTQPNVAVNTNGIREVREHTIVDNTGIEHPIDAIILGTGFKTHGLPLTDRIYDSEGVAMADRWAGNPTAYLGTAVAGYPNCYLIHGPNIGTGHNSVLHMFESQANYIAGAISHVRDHGLAGVEPSQAAQAAYTADVDRMSEGTVWTAGGCQSWYLNESGRNVNIWPGSTLDFRRRTLRFDPTAHLTHRAIPGRTPMRAAA